MKIKTYYADISEISEAELKQLSRTLPKYRQIKIATYLDIDDKKRSALAGKLLQQACIDFDKKGLDELVEENQFGKLMFPSTSGLYFSISHSKEKVMVVISDHLVGCDIEAVREPNMQVANRFFGDKEKTDLQNGKKHDFFVYWTAKEAYLKAIGTGFHNALSSIQIIKTNDGYTLSDSSYELLTDINTFEKYVTSIVYKK